MLATVPLPGCWVRTRTPSSACSRSRAGRCASAAVEPAPGCRHYLRWPRARISTGQQSLHVSGVVRFTAGAACPSLLTAIPERHLAGGLDPVALPVLLMQD